MNLFMKGPRFSKGHSIKIQSLTFPPSLAFINEKDVKLCVLTLCRPVFFLASQVSKHNNRNCLNDTRSNASKVCVAEMTNALCDSGRSYRIFLQHFLRVWLAIYVLCLGVCPGKR